MSAASKADVDSVANFLAFAILTSVNALSVLLGLRILGVVEVTWQNFAGLVLLAMMPTNLLWKLDQIRDAKVRDQ